MDEKPWMLINENVAKEELFHYAEKVHELEMYLHRHSRWIYFKCNKFGPDERICQFKICGRIIDKNQQKQGGNGEAQMDDDDANFIETAEEDAEVLDANNQENADGENQPLLYKWEILFNCKI